MNGRWRSNGVAESKNLSAAIILAAGGSSRMGRSKQLLPIGGTSLLLRAIRVADAAGAEKVIVVAGADAALVSAEAERAGASVLYNDTWEEGVGSSIRRSAEAVAADRMGLNGVLFLLCDQVGVSVQHLRWLLDVPMLTGKGIAATEYDFGPGVPAWFSVAHLASLARLSGDHGAKEIFRRHAADLATLRASFPFVDIDDPRSYEEALEMSSAGSEEVGSERHQWRNIRLWEGVPVP